MTSVSRDRFARCYLERDTAGLDTLLHKLRSVLTPAVARELDLLLELNPRPCDKFVLVLAGMQYIEHFIDTFVEWFDRKALVAFLAFLEDAFVQYLDGARSAESGALLFPNVACFASACAAEYNQC